MKERTSMTEGLQGQILEQISGLPREQQRQVLEFARTLSASRGVPGKELLRFGGLIPKEELQRMNAAIEEGCERMDDDAW
jgi:hypothetical protein